MERFVDTVIKKYGNYLYWLYVCLILYLLLYPIELNFTRQRNYNIIPLHTISLYLRYSIRNIKRRDLSFYTIFQDIGIRNLAANVLLFFPIGYGMKRMWKVKKLWHAILLCLCIPIGIESLQFVLCPARHFDVDDILLNTLGLWVGVFFAYVSSRKKK